MPALDAVTLPRHLEPGVRLGRYVVLRLLARGGMAEVCLARETAPGGMQRLVALKIVLPQYSRQPEFKRMFLNEARIVATLDHPHVAQLLEVGELGGEPYLAMQYVHGRTVRELLVRLTERDERMPLAGAVALVTAACAGLHYAHQRRDVHGKPLRIVHRDVSPSNIMVRFDGVLKILDFGIAKAASQTGATSTGVLKGKAGYMSPEQCSGGSVDHRSDVFNLGILLYEATTLRRAFVGDNPAAVINQIAKGEVRSPSVLVDDYPTGLETIVLKALARDPEDRYPSAEALQLDLEKFAARHGLELGVRTLQSVMRDAFGDEPYPEVALAAAGLTEVASPAEPDVAPQDRTVLADVVVDHETGGARRQSRWLVVAGGVAVAASAAIYIGQREPSAVAAEPAKAVRVAPIEVGPTTSPPVTEPPPVAENNPEPVTSKLPEAEAAAAPAPTGAQATRARPHRKKKRKSRGTDKPARKGPKQMWPPE